MKICFQKFSLHLEKLLRTIIICFFEKITGHLPFGFVGSFIVGEKKLENVFSFKFGTVLT